MFNFVYIYIASANLFPSLGKSGEHSHWIVRSSNEAKRGESNTSFLSGDECAVVFQILMLCNTVCYVLKECILVGNRKDTGESTGKTLSSMKMHHTAEHLKGLRVVKHHVCNLYF